MSGGYVRTSWGSVHVLTSRRAPLATQLATGLPALVMLHQSPLSARRYREVLDGLSEFCVPIAVDTPGYGESDAPPQGWTIDDYADVAWAVADAIGARKPWLFGRATGAAFALHAAARRPGVAEGVILHGVPVYTEAERADRLASFAPPWKAVPDGSHLSWIWDRVRGEYPWAPPELVTELVRDYLHAGPDFASSYRAIWRHDLRDSVQAAGEVALLLAGSEDRIRHMHPRAVELIRHRRALEVPGATDFLAEQDPDTFCRVLREVIEPRGAMP
ncbi:Pimeloyl-ACP methyl ester carboxylesterase [Lentzea fradiae]|uniref:Pimeloyl-ACP methyl ester carboxylesterase n=1 Tax=Lentzea fradiae TaxID=200378 RepID=A0A1G7KDI3_9PSEU|nr:alpha/beta hydrolase [Lentzea fradiae]SDF35242.1 Pimeloyl-ACP methyl ester carboxylesterase [Lentzea fradiae]